MTETIRTTLGALAEAEPALRRLLAQRLPVKTAYRLAKLGAVVFAETQTFHAQRDADIRALGAERPLTEAERQQHGLPDGTVVAVLPEHAAEFAQRLAELTALAVTLAVAPIPVASLGAIEIAPADLLALAPLLEGGPA